MPLITSQPVNLTNPVLATAFSILSFTVDVDGQSVNIVYQAGSVDSATPAVFTPAPNLPNQEIALSGATFAAMLSANPALYPAIKAALYGAIEQAHSITGSSIL